MTKYDLNQYKHIFHLSHTDLDGFGCQYVTMSNIEDLQSTQVHFSNANYGDGILNNIKTIIKEIKNVYVNEEHLTKTDILFIVTDLNLSEEQIEAFDAAGAHCELYIVDHHPNCDAVIEKDYAHINSRASATKLWADILDYKSDAVETINIADLYIACDGLERATMAGDLVRRLPIPITLHPVVAFASIKFISLLKHSKTALDIELNNYSDTRKILSDFIPDNVDTSNMTVKRMSTIIYLRYGLYIKVKIGDTIAAFTLAPPYFNNLAHELRSYHLGNENALDIKAINPDLLDIDVLIKLTDKPGVNLRGVKKEVRDLAIKLFDGGGHPMASGGRREDFEVYDDETMEAYVDNLLKTKGIT